MLWIVNRYSCNKWTNMCPRSSVFQNTLCIMFEEFRRAKVCQSPWYPARITHCYPGNRGKETRLFRCPRALTLPKRWIFLTKICRTKITRFLFPCTRLFVPLAVNGVSSELLNKPAVNTMSWKKATFLFAAQKSFIII